MATQYSWFAPRMMQIVYSGDAKGKAANHVQYGPKGLRRNYCDELKKLNAKAPKATYSYKTNMGTAKLTLTGTCIARRFSPNEAELPPKEANTWEVDDYAVWAESVELPTGYSMDVRVRNGRIIKKTTQDATFPLFETIFDVEVGPMVGSWTQYTHRLKWDPRSRKVTWT